VNTWRYLTDPSLAGLYWPGIAAALALVLMCALLSVVVVLKRLAFIGQGISHAAFGGVGIAAIAGLAATGAAPAPMHGVPQFLIVLGFCVGAALLIGFLTDRGAARADTVIGIVLVASMAIGAILIARSRNNLSWESFLFGSLLSVNRADAVMGWALAALTLAGLWLMRRSLIFWAFDEPAAVAFGVRAAPVKMLLMLLLAGATVTAMKLAGVVLATALLVMPGAIALRLSVRLASVLLLSVAAAAAAILGGIVVSFEFDLPTGACIVCVMTVLYALAAGVGTARR